jgi:hypothetical protein
MHYVVCLISFEEYPGRVVVSNRGRGPERSHHSVTGMVMDGRLIPPSQGDHELEMLRTIQQSGWRGPIGVIAEQGGDAEVTLGNDLRGLDWLSKELAHPGSGGGRPRFIEITTASPSAALIARPPQLSDGMPEVARHLPPPFIGIDGQNHCHLALPQSQAPAIGLQPRLRAVVRPARARDVKSPVRRSTRRRTIPGR